jgi:hypothetical protein
MSSQPIVRVQQRVSLLTAASLAVVCIALLVASPSMAATGTRSDTAAWCAIVIQINTKYGAMKNKHYLPGNKVPLKAQEAIISAALAQRTQILAVTPAVIKKAMSDELTYYAHLKARGYSNPASLAPFTTAEAGQLLTFQRTKCGITGP